VLSAADLPAGPVELLGPTHAARIRTMVQDMIAVTAESDSVRMSPQVWDAMMELRQFLFDEVYFSPKAKAEEPRANHVVQALFFHYLDHPGELPADLRPKPEDELPQAVIDYVAGMTDRFAIRDFERLFVPKKWLV
jgi:dGTPase